MANDSFRASDTFKIPPGFDTPQPESIPGSSFVRQNPAPGASFGNLTPSQELEQAQLSRPSGLRDTLKYADTIQYTPENQSEAFQLFKNLENDVASYRADALAIDESEKKGIWAIWSLARPPLTLEDLVKQEAHIGGAMFGNGHRFWLDHKGNSEYVKHNNIGDWYYTRPSNPDDLRSPEIVIHYETRPNRISKLYMGKPYALSLAELETFCKAVPQYVTNVREKLYPFSATVHDLQEEVDLEHAPIPDRAEQMFGKEVVDRIIQRHRVTLQLKENLDHERIIIPDTAEEMFGEEAINRMVREHYAEMEAKAKAKSNSDEEVMA